MKCKTCQNCYDCSFEEESTCKRNFYSGYKRNESVYDETAEELAKLLFQINPEYTYVEAAKFLLDNGVMFEKLNVSISENLFKNDNVLP